MSYFDNANNKVTRKSFGSKVDKEFKREGVIPVRDRNKDKQDHLAESAAKYQELNKKVNERRVNDLKERKNFDTKIQEGYKNLKDDLMKDFISEICVESLLVDEEVVTENLKNILELIETQVDDIGGFEGVKRIAESTNNLVLLNMVKVCEATAKKVGERNIKEAKNDSKKISFGLNKLELEEYDYRKKEMGSETIVNNIKDKVFQVVQDEQKLSSDRQMVMDDIQNKVNELQAPVEEAMKFIFEGPGIEEDSLFNSMMRKHYKQILESNSSAIFESFDYKEEQDTLFENEEFDMSDLDVHDLSDEDMEEIEDMFLKECHVDHEISLEEYKEISNNVYQKLYEGSQGIVARNQAEHFKSMIRRIQNELESIKEQYVHEDDVQHTIELEEEKLHMEATTESIKAKLNTYLSETEDPAIADEKQLEKEMKSSGKSTTEEVILCPKCGKEECSCKVAKESEDSCISKLDDLCETMNEIIDSHDNARNNVIESLTREIDNRFTLVPYLQTKDVNLNNLEFVYKTKIVCETLKNNLRYIEYINEAQTLNRAVDLNIKSIEETLEVIKENTDMEYKTKILLKGKGYLERVKQVLESKEYSSDEPLMETSTVFKTPEDVDNIFEQVREYYVIESTDKDLMELVMAEVIVDYTILETFNTLNLIKYTKDSVRQMSRKNISK